MTDEQRALFGEQIEAERQRWAALTPEQRAAHLREEQAARARKADDLERVAQLNLETALAAFDRLRQTARPPTAAEEAEYRQKKARKQLKSLGIASEHLRRVDPDWQCVEQEFVFRKTRQMCDQGSGAIIVLAGARGTGKTTIAAEIMRLRVEAEIAWNAAKGPGERVGMAPPLDPGRYEKLSRLGAMLKALYADFGSVSQERATGFLEAWCRLPLVVIDEVHEQDGLVTHQRLLTDLCDRRYAAGHNTILITNHEPEKFQQAINPSILSRIDQYGKIWPCNWRSWRALKP